MITPGPWHIYDRGRGIGWEVHASDNRPVNREMRGAFRRADAVAIACLPELLEALKAARIELYEREIAPGVVAQCDVVIRKSEVDA